MALHTDHEGRNSRADALCGFLWTDRTSLGKGVVAQETRVEEGSIVACASSCPGECAAL